MRVMLRSLEGELLGEVAIESIQSPPRVTTDTGRDVFLDWERALDDNGRLRRCVSCGSEHLYRRRRFPQVTGFVVVLAIALGLVSALGLATGPLILAALIVLGIADIVILIVASQSLDCYQCRSSYRDLDIATYHRPWQANRKI